MPTPDTPYLKQIANTTFQPIFILGDQRSGTTLFYDLLTQTGAFNFVSAYHVIAYDELLANHAKHCTAIAMRELNERFQKLGVSDRAIDQMRVRADLPEEYVFLLKKGLRILPKTLPSFIEACRKIQYISNHSKPLLLKGPTDTANFLRIRHYFPSAPILFIHRHPLEVLNSKIKALQLLLNETNPYYALINPGYARLMQRWPRRKLLQTIFSSRGEIGPRILARHTIWGARYYANRIEELEPSCHLTVRYEDLCANPNEVVNKVLDFLGAPDHVAFDLSNQIAKRPVHFRTETRRCIPQMKRGLKDYCERFGYDLDV
ncbi:sulfotransferase family protein [Thioflavicoccus mobilis 8321]|uniref:Sulfotransferase family protein n=1 Tax=Thioflavicoccus mobilis 8321 TaxID=765912 RepID=L0H090_9GAMM|nr:sulfotransferase [Thioflavicoccus mobilis]AGA90989.1 sulfotransferase family protein [Thioflavicoccus mobilis 8321]